MIRLDDIKPQGSETHMTTDNMTIEQSLRQR